MVTDASLRDIQRRCPPGVDSTQLRANFTIAGAQPWEEDTWRLIRIGSVEFVVAKPCSRCILTTVHPYSGKPHSGGEPMPTLRNFRSTASGDIHVGLNLVARSSGLMRVGDRVHILKSGNAPSHGAGSSVANHCPRSDKNQRQVVLLWEGKNSREIIRK